MSPLKDAVRQLKRRPAFSFVIVAIVNESFVARFSLGGDAIGRRFRPRGANADVEIVGVVADATQSGAGVKAQVPPHFYQPIAQVDPAFVPSRYFYVRSAIAPESLLRAIPRAVADVDPNLPVATLQTLEAQFGDDVYVDRLVTALSAGFSVVVLAASYGPARRAARIAPMAALRYE